MDNAAVMWFRRDLRLSDNPALVKAAASGSVAGVFVLDPELWPTAGLSRRLWLARSLRALSDSMDGKLLVRHGDPADQLLQVAQAAGASQVHIAGESEPYGYERDTRVEKALAAVGIELVRTGTPYAVSPGTVRRPDDAPYSVYSPFMRHWEEAAIPDPAPTPRNVQWLQPVESHGLPEEPDPDGLVLPDVGERAAARRWSEFRRDALASYKVHRDRPDIDGTSAMSGHLKYGEIHPRTLLAELEKARKDGVSAAAIAKFRAELAWREFYADVLWHRPQLLTESLKPQLDVLVDPPSDDSDRRFTAWAEGRTGFPFVDAGMRQLQAIGWVHNRVRMVVASFLVKDLHLPWQRGADHFYAWLRDGDPASNYAGWQWVAGTGTDPAPYLRVFNPVKQGLDFDPEGDYVRRFVPELRDVPGSKAHQPWELPEMPAGYPERIVDHAEERRESLRRYDTLRA